MVGLLKKHRILCGILAAVLTLPIAVLPTGAETESEISADTETDSDTQEEEIWHERSEQDVLARMRKAAENDKLELWVWDDTQLDTENDEKPEDLFALINKANGYIWWSSPINAGGDSIASPVLRSELRSGMVLTAAQIMKRSVTHVRSGDTLKTDITFDDIKNGVKVTYFFRKVGIRIPVSYVLEDDCLSVSVDTADITEKYENADEKTVLAQSVSLLNAFGAADSQEDGYFVIPDGSGAIINFNNQKNSAKTYQQMVYDTDVTAVPKTKGPVVEGVSLPMYGICKGENAMLAVAAEGDGSCMLCADVSGTGQSNTEYNRCYFEFVLRASDQYYLGGDQLNSLDVYEQKLTNRKLQVRYYPLTASDTVNADGGKSLDYVDIAARYRQYLLEEKQVPKTAEANQTSLYIDLYGGCMKQRNVLGFPVFMKTAVTSYSEMQDILQRLRDAGAENMTVSMNRWTDAGISGKVDFKAKASGTLGGASDFKKLTAFMEQNEIAWYPTVTNTAYYSGNGYRTLHDTAIRVSGSFARIVDYERAYGVPYSEKKTMSLLSPNAFPELYQKLADNYADAGYTRVSIGGLSSVLYGDYGKKTGTSRDRTKEYVADSLKLLQSEVGAVLSKDPNAYVLPYTDTITDMPLFSSGFHLFDGDIPLYQLVMHGVMPYSTKAVNGSYDAEQLVMLALASGSNLRFDLLGAESSELKDTDFDVYYYANADHWIENAAQYYQFTKDILAQVSDSEIISYVREDDKIVTTYVNGTETVVDLNECAVTVNGQTRYLKDYIEEGTARLT